MGVVPHPQLQLKVRVADDDFIPNNQMSKWEKVYRYIEEKTVSDSGAQLTLLPRDKAEKLGLDVNKLSPGEIEIKGAGGEIIPYHGVVVCGLQAEDDDGVEHETLELCYVIKSSGGPLYLSHMAQRSLDFLHSRYPKPMTAQQLSVDSLEADSNGDTEQGTGDQNTTGAPAAGAETSHRGSHDAESYEKVLHTPVECDGSIDLDGNRLCKCPERVKAPDPPETTIPMLESNIPRLKQLILDHYGASAFNQCENQLVSTMEDTPPMKIFIPADYKPYTAVNAAPVPLHAQGQVRAMISKQCKMGIIKPIGLNDHRSTDAHAW